MAIVLGMESINQASSFLPKENLFKPCHIATLQSSRNEFFKNGEPSHGTQGLAEDFST